MTATGRNRRKYVRPFQKLGESVPSYQLLSYDIYLETPQSFYRKYCNRELGKQWHWSKNNTEAVGGGIISGTSNNATRSSILSQSALSGYAHYHGWLTDLQQVELWANELPKPETGAPEFVCTGSKDYYPPLDLTSYPHHHLLTLQEQHAASTLRLQPAQYLTIKRRLLLADQLLKTSSNGDTGYLRRSEAQKLCRVDVNKVGYLLQWFRQLGWVKAPPTDSVGMAKAGRKRKLDKMSNGVGGVSMNVADKSTTPPQSLAAYARRIPTRGYTAAVAAAATASNLELLEQPESSSRITEMTLTENEREIQLEKLPRQL